MATGRILGSIAFVFGVHMACGCREHVHNDGPRRVPLNEHGIHLGQEIGPLTIHCTDGEDRTIGARSAMQLITISAVNDCAECQRHLTGLEQVYKEDRLQLDQFVVTSASPTRRADVLAAYRARTNRPVCIDTEEALWHQSNLSHTPVTLLVRNGRVAYIDDAPTETAAEIALFTRQVARAANWPR